METWYINDRIEQLRKRIRSVEEYNLKYNDKANSDSGINGLKLLKDGEKRERLRHFFVQFKE